MKTDRIRSHVSNRGLEGQSSERGDDRRISVHDRLGAGFQCMIGWGAGPCYVILQEEGFLPMSELSGLLFLKFQMNTHTTEIRRESLFMIILIGLSGAREV
jgi:hypothetical protein